MDSTTETTTPTKTKRFHPSQAERARLYRLFDEIYDGSAGRDQGRYKGDWTDRKVADHMGWPTHQPVAVARRELFGNMKAEEKPELPLDTAVEDALLPIRAKLTQLETALDGLAKLAADDVAARTNQIRFNQEQLAINGRHSTMFAEFRSLLEKLDARLARLEGQSLIAAAPRHHTTGDVLAPV